MLSDKIWITRKSRINAEKRLKTCSHLSQILMIYYSFILVALSIWNLLYDVKIVNLILIFGSVAILAISVFLSSQKFIERSLAMRNCYIKLDEIYLKLKKAEDEKNSELISQLESEYFSILQNIENHSEYDYLNLRFFLRKNKETTLPPFKKRDWLYYMWEKFWRISVIFLFFLLPLIIGIICNRIT